MKKCKNCKSKFTPKFFNQKYCLKDDCISVMTKEAIKKAKEKKKKNGLKENQNLKNL